MLRRCRLLGLAGFTDAFAGLAATSQRSEFDSPAAFLESCKRPSDFDLNLSISFWIYNAWAAESDDEQ
jgi:hypothetical protein